jgi:hypothetical protein
MQANTWEKMRGLSEDLNTKNKTNWGRKKGEASGSRREVKRGQKIWGRRGFEEQKIQLGQTQNLLRPIFKILDECYTKY